MNEGSYTFNVSQAMQESTYLSPKNIVTDLHNFQPFSEVKSLPFTVNHI